MTSESDREALAEIVARLRPFGSESAFNLSIADDILAAGFARPRAAETIGYVVLAKRPDVHHDAIEFDYQPAGGVWPTLEPVENHQGYCEALADSNPQRYGNAEYVIGRIELFVGGDGE